LVVRRLDGEKCVSVLVLERQTTGQKQKKTDTDLRPTGYRNAASQLDKMIFSKGDKVERLGAMARRLCVGQRPYTSAERVDPLDIVIGPPAAVGPAHLVLHLRVLCVAHRGVPNNRRAK
jgi:hypothetical protein